MQPDHKHNHQCTIMKTLLQPYKTPPCLPNTTQLGTVPNSYLHVRDARSPWSVGAASVPWRGLGGGGWFLLQRGSQGYVGSAAVAADVPVMAPWISAAIRVVQSANLLWLPLLPPPLRWRWRSVLGRGQAKDHLLNCSRTLGSGSPCCAHSCIVGL